MGKAVVAVYLRYYLSPSETFVYRQLQGAKNAFDPIVLTAFPSNLDRFPTDPIYVRGKGFPGKVYARLAGAFTGRFSVLTPKQRTTFERALNHHRAQLIHAHFGHFGLDMLPIARRLNLPLLVTFHGFDASRLLHNPRYTRALRELFAYAHVITVSNNMAKRLRPFGLNDSRRQTHYIGVPVENFQFTERRPIADKMQSGEIEFLQVANFVEKKGHRYTVDAFARFVKKHPAARLTFAGEGALRADIERACAEKGIGDCVRFVGRVNSVEVAALMKAADVFLHHSVTAASGDMEGIPTVIMEAMATGLIVVSTRHSGIAELVEDDVTGLLVDERDVDAYAARLETLIDVDSDMGRRARKHIEDHFNIAIQNEKLVGIYKTAMMAGSSSD